MTKIISTPNCGNSPKMELLKEFNIAFAKGNIAFITDKVTDNISWNIIGDKCIEGKKDFIIELEKMKSEIATELIIEQILSHGKEGAATGIIKMQNGKKYAFSDFYKFNGVKDVKIKSIISHVIGI